MIAALFNCYVVIIGRWYSKCPLVTRLSYWIVNSAILTVVLQTLGEFTFKDYILSYSFTFSDKGSLQALITILACIYTFLTVYVDYEAVNCLHAAGSVSDFKVTLRNIKNDRRKIMGFHTYNGRIDDADSGKKQNSRTKSSTDSDDEVFTLNLNDNEESGSSATNNKASSGSATNNETPNGSTSKTKESNPSKGKKSGANNPSDSSIRPYQLKIEPYRAVISAHQATIYTDAEDTRLFKNCFKVTIKPQVSELILTANDLIAKGVLAGYLASLGEYYIQIVDADSKLIFECKDSKFTSIEKRESAVNVSDGEDAVTDSLEVVKVFEAFEIGEFSSKVKTYDVKLKFNFGIEVPNGGKIGRVTTIKHEIEMHDISQSSRRTGIWSGLSRIPIISRVPTLINRPKKSPDKSGPANRADIREFLTTVRNKPLEAISGSENIRLISFAKYTNVRCPVGCGHPITSRAIKSIHPIVVEHPGESLKYQTGSRIIAWLEALREGRLQTGSIGNYNITSQDLDQLKEYYTKTVIPVIITYYNRNNKSTKLEANPDHNKLFIVKDTNNPNVTLGEIANFTNSRIANWVQIPLGDWDESSMEIKPWSFQDEVTSKKLKSLILSLNQTINPSLLKNAGVMERVFEGFDNNKLYLFSTAKNGDSTEENYNAHSEQWLLTTCCPHCCTTLPESFYLYDEVNTIKYFGNTSAGKTVLLASEQLKKVGHYVGNSTNLGDKFFNDRRSMYKKIASSLQKGKFPPPTSLTAHLPYKQTSYSLTYSNYDTDSTYDYLTAMFSIDMPGETSTKEFTMDAHVCYIHNLLDYCNLDFDYATKTSTNSLEEEHVSTENFPAEEVLIDTENPESSKNFFKTLIEAFSSETDDDALPYPQRDLHFMLSRIDEYPVFVQEAIDSVNSVVSVWYNNLGGPSDNTYVKHGICMVRPINKVGFAYTWALLIAIIIKTYKFFEVNSDLNYLELPLKQIVPEKMIGDFNNAFRVLAAELKLKAFNIDGNDTLAELQLSLKSYLTDARTKIPQGKTLNNKEIICDKLISFIEAYFEGLYKFPICFYNTFKFFLDFIRDCYHIKGIYHNPLAEYRLYAVSATGFNQMESLLDEYRSLTSQTQKVELNPRFLGESANLMHISVCDYDRTTQLINAGNKLDSFRDCSEFNTVETTLQGTLEPLFTDVKVIQDCLEYLEPSNTLEDCVPILEQYLDAIKTRATASSNSRGTVDSDDNSFDDLNDEIELSAVDESNDPNTIMDIANLSDDIISVNEDVFDNDVISVNEDAPEDDTNTLINQSDNDEDTTQLDLLMTDNLTEDTRDSKGLESSSSTNPFGTIDFSDLDSIISGFSTEKSAEENEESTEEDEDALKV